MKNIFFFVLGFIFFSGIIAVTLCQSNSFIVKENKTEIIKERDLPSDAAVFGWDTGLFDILGFGDNATGIVAARFSDTLTSLYSGYYLEQIEIFIGEIPSSLVLKVFDEGTDTSAGPLIYSQDVSNLITQLSWNIFDVNPPILITGNDIWIGYEVTMTLIQYVIGIDSGFVHPDGDWLFDPSDSSYGWYHLSDFGFDNNWIIRGYLTHIMPVELTSFTGNSVDGNVTLNWSTATEINNRAFEIERRKENSTFVLIGFVEGNGTTTEKQEYTFVDKNITTGKYYYRLKQIDFDGTFEYSNEIEVDAAPVSFSLEQNYPNPFNPSTKISYSIPHKSFVTLKVFDPLGRIVDELVSKEKEAGRYELDFNAVDLSSGVYFYKLEAGDFIQTKKMILVR